MIAVLGLVFFAFVGTANAQRRVVVVADARGIRRGSEVRVADARVGRVRAVIVENGRARLTLDLDRRAQFDRGHVCASVRSSDAAAGPLILVEDQSVTSGEHIPECVARARALTSEELDRAIRRVDDQHVSVTRGFVDRVFEDPMTLLADARLVPAVEDGRPVGFRVYGVRPNAVLARVGLRNGDTLQAVNGHSFESPDTALRASQAIRTASQFVVSFLRRGARVEITVDVAD